MKIVNLIAMVLIGANFGMRLCFAAPISAGSHSRAIASFASDESSDLIQVVKKNQTIPRKRTTLILEMVIPLDTFSLPTAMPIVLGGGNGIAMGGCSAMDS
jgi:hypothetical protein